MLFRPSRCVIERPLGVVAFGVVTAFLALAGCHADHRQSMLHPASSASSEIAGLWWFLFAVCTTVFVVVIGLLLMAIWGRPSASQPPSDARGSSGQDGSLATAPRSPLGHRFIVVSGIIVPSLVLVALLVVSVRAQVALATPEPDFTIRVVGHMWWWEVRYPEHQIVTANEIIIPVGEPVRVELTSADVIHSLWVPNLQGKMDMLPGKINTTWLASNRTGTFRGQCAEYCGVQHALMGLHVRVLPRDEFDAWVADRQRAPKVEQTDSIRRGREVFFDVGCDSCHAIAGTEATGPRGPDLTHVGSRERIGAGLLPNNRGNLGGWISNPQAIKPGNLMPRTHIPAEDLHPLLDYLESLQ